MATSGTASYTPSIVELVEEAFERAGVEMRSGYDLRTARRSLDIMMAEWANRGLNLWTIDQGSIALTPGTAIYTLPADTVDILDHVLRQGTGASQTDTQLERLGQGGYSAIGNKNISGLPTCVYVQRVVPPTVTLWPVPNAAYSLVYWRLRRIQDTGSGTNTMDVPFRFVPPLVAGLAYYIAMKKPQVQDRVPFLKEIYEEQFALAADEDRDRTSLFLAGRDFGL